MKKFILSMLFVLPITAYAATTFNETIGQTGQEISYVDGDDGWYKAGNLKSLASTTGLVFDHITGLVWQDDADAKTYKANQLDAIAYCEELTLGDKNDWRLPSYKELLTLTDFSKVSPTIHSEFTNVATELEDSYISSTNYAKDTTKAYSINYSYLYTGIDKVDRYSNSFNVRCVRGEPLSSARLTRDANNIVTDSGSSLMWQDNKRENNQYLNFGEAIEYCNNLKLGDYSDWRLPNVNEMLLIIENSSSEFTINSIFQNTTSNYWTSTTVLDDENYGIVTNFFSVLIYQMHKAYMYNDVRCVRGGNLSYANTKKIGDSDISSKSYNETITKTGQSTSYIDGDDGWYSAGEQKSFTRNSAVQIVKDNVTGLMWQDNEDARNREASQSAGISYCESIVLNGFSDWRLPSRKELFTLLDFGNVPAINKTFKNFSNGNTYVSSTVYPNDTIMAKVISFDGASSIGGASSKKYGKSNVRCVRGNPLIEASLSSNVDDIVIDNANGLMWQDDIAAKNTEVSYTNAFKQCENLELGKFSDWRLPNVNEINLIMDDSKRGSAFNTVFQNSATYYWTSTSMPSDSSQAVVASFGAGYMYGASKEYEYDVRCVRGGNVTNESVTNTDIADSTANNNENTTGGKAPTIHSIRASKNRANAGMDIDFSALVTDEDGTIKSYSWNFGDGSKSTKEKPSHSFSSIGTYTVTLSVTDNDNLTTTKTKPIEVIETPVATLLVQDRGNLTYDITVNMSSGESISKVVFYLDNEYFLESKIFSPVASEKPTISVTLPSGTKGDHSLHANVQTVSSMNYKQIADIYVGDKDDNCVDDKCITLIKFYHMQLQSGWNLTTLWFKDNDLKASKLKEFEDIEAFYLYDSSNQEWEGYLKEDGILTFDVIERGRGFFVKSSKDFQMIFSINDLLPSLPETTISYTPGWNLLGLPTNKSQKSDDLLKMCDGVKTIWIARNNRWHGSDNENLTILTTDGFWVEASKKENCKIK